MIMTTTGPVPLPSSSLGVSVFTRTPAPSFLSPPSLGLSLSRSCPLFMNVPRTVFESRYWAAWKLSAKSGRRVQACARVCVCVCLRVRFNCAQGWNVHVAQQDKGEPARHVERFNATPNGQCPNTQRGTHLQRGLQVVVVCKVAESDAGPAPAPTAGLVLAAPSFVAATAAASSARARAPAVRMGESAAPAQRIETVEGRRQGVGLPFRDGCLARTAQMCMDAHTQTGATRQQGAARAVTRAAALTRGWAAVAQRWPGPVARVGEQPHGPKSQVAQGVANTHRPSACMPTRGALARGTLRRGGDVARSCPSAQALPCVVALGHAKQKDATLCKWHKEASSAEWENRTPTRKQKR